MIPARFVWVGRISSEKRLGMLLEAAVALPNVRFDVAGEPAGDDRDTRATLARARALPNVRLLGRVSRERMTGVYAGAAGLICTSTHEGFPNTFLEAWSFGLPVVSTIDPDDLIRDRGLGVTAADSRDLVIGITRLIDSREDWRQISVNARQYYVSLHRLDDALVRFEELFAEVGQGRAALAGRARAQAAQ